jgi:thiosulfate dehydrogenase
MRLFKEELSSKNFENTQTHRLTISMITGFALLTVIIFSCSNGSNKSTAKSGKALSAIKPAGFAWIAPDSTKIPPGKAGDQIRYGKELLAHTAEYFGPNGQIAQLSNGMNCQNCHLEGGARAFANNYALVSTSYPRLSNRSGTIQPISQRISDCFNRSLAGHAPDTNGHEIQAMIAYMKWMGAGVKKGQKIYGAATEKLPFLNVAADPVKGQVVYVAKCKVCHGINGDGQFAADKRSYTYPPLWGPHSYNDGAGMYRISNLAGFVKNNMPFGVTYRSPQLTNDEAWNVAAFINSQPRPHFDQHHDWKDLKTKPIDFPFGPYADGFSEQQHKYGPFKPIETQRKKMKAS